jgi:hypothetical protein
LTLIEFLAPLRKRPIKDKCLATLFYEETYNSNQALAVEDLRKNLVSARVPRANQANLADVLSKTGHFVHAPGKDLYSRRVWSLTDSGRKYVRESLGLLSVEAEVNHDVTTLQSIATALKDPLIREYVLEALKCLNADALRAAVVFLWTGAIRVLQEKALAVGGRSLNAAVSKHDPKARPITKIEDFAYLKDSVSLLALQELGIIDKGEKGTLEEALNLRNRCGHPTNYKPGVKKVSSFVEDVVGIVFRP